MARRHRSQLRALEAETGISRSTWSAWSRGERAIPRDRLAAVVTHYDPERLPAWLSAWDRLTDPGNTAPAGPDPQARDRPDTQPHALPQPVAAPGTSRGTRRLALVAAGAGAALALGLVGSVLANRGGALALPESHQPSGGVSASGEGTVNGSGYGLTVQVPAGHAVRQCETFTGTAQLPQDRTLVLSMRNITDGEAEFNFEPILRWEIPATDGTWQGPQFFGSGSASVDKFYEIRVFAVQRDVVRDQEAAAAAAGHDWRTATLPPGGQELARLTLVRIAGDGPPGCGQR